MSPSVKRIHRALAIAIGVVFVAGCSSAGVGTSGPPQARYSVLNVRSATAAQGNVTFAVGIAPLPLKKTTRITPKFVSPSTQSLRILTDGANPLIVNLTPTSPNCLPNPASPGAFVCTAKFVVPAGKHGFTLATYDLAGAMGNVLSTNSTGTVYVKPVGATTVSIVLKGVVGHVVLGLAPTNPPVGKAASIDLTAVLEDADGNLIIGPAPFEFPVTLTTTDSSAGALSKTVLNSPADAAGIRINYTGAKVAEITYSATATGLPAGNARDAVLTPGARSELLYVASSSFTGSVVAFDLTDPALAPATVTGSGLGAATGLALDASGKLYVADNYGLITGCDGGCVRVFDTARGNVELAAITGSLLAYPTGVALDASGRLYVASQVFDTVSVFDTAHSNAALPVITGGLDNPMGVVVDANGKLYVANYEANSLGIFSVSVFDTAHGNAMLPPITAGLTSPQGVALDASGKLYVSNSNASGSVSVFDTAHGNAVLPTITGGLNFPAGLVVDSSGKLYVTNSGANSVSVFDAAHGNAVLPTLTGGGLSAPFGLALR